jgi:hypothetical protein
MGKTIGTVALACALGGMVLVGTATRTASAERTSPTVALRALRGEIVAYRRVTWHWERVMGLRRTAVSSSERRVADLAYRRWVRNLWKLRAVAVKRRARRPPHVASWRCIHRFEASWHANTGNGYYGGLQMDLGFQRRYGAFLLRTKGTADRWSPLEQMWVAERAHRSARGFWPWPNTARYCGLV